MFHRAHVESREVHFLVSEGSQVKHRGSKQGQKSLFNFQMKGIQKNVSIFVAYLHKRVFWDRSDGLEVVSHLF